MKPCSEAAERNKEPILRVLQQVLPEEGILLEIGSGTGQHAAHFAAALPGLVWQTSELAENHPAISSWLAEGGLDNTPAPLTLDVTSSRWPVDGVEAVYSANTAHIMGWPAVLAMVRGVGAG